MTRHRDWATLPDRDVHLTLASLAAATTRAVASVEVRTGSADDFAGYWAEQDVTLDTGGALAMMAVRATIQVTWLRAKNLMTPAIR